MRKSLVFAFSGIILAFFMLSAFGNRERIYEKKEKFETPEEAIVNFIGYINTYEHIKINNGYYNTPSRKFLESISKRYRLYIGEEYFTKSIYGNLPILYKYSLEEIEYDSLINTKIEYEESFKNIPKYERDNKPIAFILKGSGYDGKEIETHEVNADGTVKILGDSEGSPVTIYLIIVDEGEGYVVDYYTRIYEE